MLEPKLMNKDVLTMPKLVQNVEHTQYGPDPFGNMLSEIGYVCNKYFGIIDYNLTVIATPISDFTIGFFYRRNDIEGDVFSLMTTDNARLVHLFYTNTGVHLSLVGNGMSQNVSLDLVPFQEWFYFALTYDYLKATLSIHRRTGDIADSFNYQIPPSENLMLRMGKMNPKDRVACVMFYKTALTPMEIAQMPCLCRSRGAKCEPVDDYRIKAKIYRKIPKRRFLEGFWPLDGKSGMFEITGRNMQRTLHRNSHLVTTDVGPFLQPSTSFTSTYFGSLASYAISNFTRTFTVSFFVKIRPGRHGQLLSLTGSDGRPYFSISYKNDRRIVVETVGNRPVAQFYLNFSNETNDWAFLALGYHSKKMLLSGFDRYGREFSTFLWVEIGDRGKKPKDHRETVLTIGPLQPHDQISCLMLWRKKLDTKNIAKLPNICRHQTDNGYVNPCKKGRKSQSLSTASKTAMREVMETATNVNYEFSSSSSSSTSPSLLNLIFTIQQLLVFFY